MTNHNWTDIAEHTVPTVAVGIAMGFMAAFGLHSVTWLETIFWVSIATISAFAFSLLWIVRERRQHGGHFGGAQSKLEAFIPAIAGPASFVASTFAFWTWPI
jgi:hypothetical protein